MSFPGFSHSCVWPEQSARGHEHASYAGTCVDFIARMTEVATPRIAGAGNFRSLGGLIARDGRRLRAHYLMRSDRLCNLSAEDWQALASTGLATICDLRSREECSQHPNCVPAALGVTELACEVRNDLRSDPSLTAMLVAQPSAEGAEQAMIEIYRRLPHVMAPVISRICERLLAGGAPLLIHCTAGKDRTGFAVAMLLHAFGVSRGEIERDYLASRAWIQAPIHGVALSRRLAKSLPMGSVEGVVAALLDVRPSYLEAAFEAISSDFGSPERYLEWAAGLDAERSARLRDLALV
jgi:protein-tyrosine phosphatase